MTSSRAGVARMGRAPGPVRGLAVIVIGVAMNWRNSRTGFWINLVLVSLLDIAFVLFVIAPGYLPLWPGLMGPIAWILAAVFSAAGLAGDRGEPVAARGHVEAAGGFALRVERGSAGPGGGVGMAGH